MPREVGRICSKLLHFLAKYLSLSTSETVNLGSRRHEGSYQSVSHGEDFEVAIEHVDKVRISIGIDEDEKAEGMAGFEEEKKKIGRMKNEATDQKGKDEKAVVRKKATTAKKGSMREGHDISKDEKVQISKKAGELTVMSNIDERSGTFIKERKESFAN